VYDLLVFGEIVFVFTYNLVLLKRARGYDDTLDTYVAVNGRRLEIVRFCKDANLKMTKKEPSLILTYLRSASRKMHVVGTSTNLRSYFLN